MREKTAAFRGLYGDDCRQAGTAAGGKNGAARYSRGPGECKGSDYQYNLATSCTDRAWLEVAVIVPNAVELAVVLGAAKTAWFGRL